MENENIVIDQCKNDKLMSIDTCERQKKLKQDKNCLFSLILLNFILGYVQQSS